ncbi:MAG: PEP-CTERM sorting domain-containing protein [Gammaproteobacteria bacterium]
MKKILAVLAAAASLSALPASADVVTHLTETFQSGATFSGTLTFADGYTNLLDAHGVLSGADYGTVDITWSWNRHWNGGLALDLDNNPATLEDRLASGEPPDDYAYTIGLSWIPNQGSLKLVIDPQLPYETGINGVDAAVSFSTSPVPEPATYAMLGLGLAAVAVMAKRRQA